jgi:hypothetical protein
MHTKPETLLTNITRYTCSKCKGTKHGKKGQTWQFRKEKPMEETTETQFIEYERRPSK